MMRIWRINEEGNLLEDEQSDNSAIYVLFSFDGTHEDYSEWIAGLYTSRDSAVKYILSQPKSAWKQYRIEEHYIEP